MEIKALIFDFDGLLVDTETPQLRVWQEIYRSFGATLLLEEWVRCLGTSAGAFDVPADLRAKTSLPFDGDALVEQFKIRSGEAILQERLRPGMADLLKAAQRRHLKMAVASSSDRAWVESGLARVNIQGYFQVVCTGDDVTTVKPDPALYHLALDHLGVNAGETLVLEDSPMGIQAAKAAGLTCVAYPNPVSINLDLSHADWILTALPADPLTAILDHFNGNLQQPHAN